MQERQISLFKVLRFMAMIIWYSLATFFIKGYNPIMTDQYQKTLDYIYSFVDYSLTHQENLSPENFDLSRMKTLMEMLGNPQDQYPTIHVAGSKGKGSVCAFLATVLEKQGYKVGLYTSPHMLSFNERIQINRQPIEDDELVDLVCSIRDKIDAVPRLTTFEITTALGFLYFAKHNVDIAVIEVGLGGRLDATNVITPLVSVITQLYLEHTYVLGDTLAKIASEKGGIIKPGVPLVISQQDDEALLVLRQIAADRHAPMHLVGKDVQYKILDTTIHGSSFEVQFDSRVNADELNGRYQIALLGDYQVENAVTALTAINVLRQMGWHIGLQSIKTGLQNTKWEGRFEIISKEPLIIIDGAHNKEAVSKLLHATVTYFPDREIKLIFGISKDKNIDGMVTAFLPYVREVICTQSVHPRAMDAFELAEHIPSSQIKCSAYRSVDEALGKVMDGVSDNDLILVTGSIFLAAAVKELLNKSDHGSMNSIRTDLKR